MSCLLCRIGNLCLEMGLCNALLTCRDSETLLLCGIVGKYCDNMTMVIMLKEIDHINPKYS